MPDDSDRALLERIEKKLDDDRQALNLHVVEDERRFGKLERLLWLIGVAVASPKIGGPDVPTLTAHVLSTVNQHL